jgi:hypothetical protein
VTTLVCPVGHRFEIATVVYGYPTDEAFEAASRGEITIGGCMPDIPVERPCPTCGRPASDSARWSGQVSDARQDPVVKPSDDPNLNVIRSLAGR